ILNYLLGVLIVCALLATFVNLLYGGITTGGRSFIASGLARVQLAVLGTLVMVVIAAKLWMSRYGLLTKVGETFDGANYTDINAVLPARGIMAGIALMVAVMFLAVIARADWRCPGVGVGLMLLASIVVGGIYPSIVQRFQVDPNAQEFEAPYIQRTIDSTLVAFGLDDVEVTTYAA